MLDNALLPRPSPPLLPSSLPPSRAGLLRPAGADSGRGLHADVLRVFSDISADPDSGAHHLGSRAPGVFSDVSRGYPLREDHGLPSGLHGPLAVWLRRRCQVTFWTRGRSNGSSVSCGVVFDAARALPLWASWWCYRSLWLVAPGRFCEPKTMSQPDTRALSWARAESKWFVALTVFYQVGCFFRSSVSSRSYMVVSLVFLCQVGLFLLASSLSSLVVLILVAFLSKLGACVHATVQFLAGPGGA